MTIQSHSKTHNRHIATTDTYLTQKMIDLADVFYVAIQSDQTVFMINNTGCEILGYSREEIIGKNWFNTFLPKRVREEVNHLHDRSEIKSSTGKSGPPRLKIILIRTT